MKRKWAATLIVSCFTLVSPISSSMIAPALDSISDEFNITNEVEAQLTLSIFVLAYAIGPLFLGPLSEIYGRVIILQLSNLFYLAWNLGCGFAQNSGQLMAFRFLSGLGGSAPLAIGGVSPSAHASIGLILTPPRASSATVSTPSSAAKQSPSTRSRRSWVQQLGPLPAASSARARPGGGAFTQRASSPPSCSVSASFSCKKPTP